MGAGNERTEGMSDALDRARADIEAGRLWKARDRLRGVVGARPGDQEVLALLGEVYLRMGDGPEAGRWLFLTERDDEAARGAIAAFRERYALGQLLPRVPAYRPIEEYPPRVRARLRELQVDARAHGLEWEPPKRRRSRRGARDIPPGDLRWTDRLVVGGIVAALVGPWLFGAARAVELLLRAGRR
jgi:hypothetical protein